MPVAALRMVFSFGGGKGKGALHNLKKALELFVLGCTPLGALVSCFFILFFFLLRENLAMRERRKKLEIF